MATTAQKDFTPLPTNPEKLEDLVSSFAIATGSEAKELRISVSYRFEDGGTDVRFMPASSLPALVPIARPISLIVLHPPGLMGPALRIYIGPDHVSMEADANPMSLAARLVETAVNALGLEPFVPSDETKLVASLERRLDAVQTLQDEEIRLRCFLSYRFTDADATVAHEVERFLQLQGVEVLTGRSYEPRRMEDKVHSRLSSALDFVIYLVTASGDSSWVRDEVSEARATGIPVIPLVEEGTEFGAGLFGNVEYIRFASGHVSDVWISLVEALSYIRAGRRRGGARGDKVEPQD